MKRLLIVVLVGLMGLLLSGAMMPPELPSSFYGVITNGQVGQTVTTNLLGSTETFAWQGTVVYAMNVTGGVEGQKVMFYVDGQKAGSGTYHIGTNQNVDLKVKGFAPIVPPFVKERR